MTDTMKPAAALSPPSAWSSPTEAELSMPRAKPRSLLASMTYRGVRLGSKVFGDRRVLRLLLDASWILRRIAFELSGRVYGEQFHLAALGLSESQVHALIQPDASLLDIGCGTGHWCRAAAPLAGSVVGVDYNARSLEVARRSTVNENVEYLQVYADKDLYERLDHKKFDLITLIHVLEHVDEPTSLLQSLHEIAPVLIVEVPDFEADSLNWVRLRLGTSYYQDADHVREYTEAILRDHVGRSGWRIDRLTKRGGAIVAVASSTSLP